MLALVVAFSVAGCSKPIFMMSAEQLQTVDPADLCHAYHNYKTDAIRAELERRGFISDLEWEYVDQERYFIGMGTGALYCVMGKPFRSYTSTSEYGTIRTLRYGQSPYYTYIYTLDGVVTGWDY